MKLCLRLLILCGCMWICTSLANSLYQAQIPVKSQHSAEREEAIGQALQQVLVRVSGNNAIATLPGIQSQLHRAKQLAERYTYKHDRHGRLLLNVAFEENAVDNLIRQYGQYFWGQQRPRLLVWMAVEDQRGLHVAAADESQGDNHSAVKLLQSKSTQRGLRITLPVLDLEDMQRISQDDILQQNASQLLKAAKRYAIDDLLLVSVMQIGERWVGNWTLYFRGQPLVWQLKADTLPELVSNGINNVTDAIVARVATADNTRTEHVLELKVDGIASVDDYIGILTTLRHLDTVNDVQVANVGSGSVNYQVTYTGEPRQFKERVTGLSQLQFLAGNDASLQYRLVS